MSDNKEYVLCNNCYAFVGENVVEVTKWEDFFRDSIDYPREVALNPLPFGTVYNYIANDFLNGFINLVEIKRAWCLNRYNSLGDVYTNSVKVKHPANASKFEWVDLTVVAGKEEITKKEALDILLEPGRTHHVRPDDYLQDDVLILAKVKDWPSDDLKKESPTLAIYYFFWYDRDCSDCCIGRFKTNVPESKVFELFDVYVEGINAHNSPLPEGEPIEPPTLIPLHFFTGWVKA